MLWSLDAKKLTKTKTHTHSFLFFLFLNELSNPCFELTLLTKTNTHRGLNNEVGRNIYNLTQIYSFII